MSTTSTTQLSGTRGSGDPGAPPELLVTERGRTGVLGDVLRSFSTRATVAVEVIALFAIWQLIVGVWKIGASAFVPTPSQIWGSFVAMARAGTLADDLEYSGMNFVIGFAIAAGAGTIFGFALGAFRVFRDMAIPPFLFAYAVPAVAIQPLLVLWMGFGREPKTLIVVIMAFFPIAMTVHEGVKSVDPVLLRAGRVFGARRLGLQLKILLPAALPFVLVGLELGVARGIVGVVIGEFIGGTEGLGYRLQLAGEQFAVAQGLALTFVLIVVANVAVFLLRILQRWLAPWSTVRRR